MWPAAPDRLRPPLTAPDRLRPRSDRLQPLTIVSDRLTTESGNEIGYRAHTLIRPGARAASARGRTAGATEPIDAPTPMSVE